jgi:DNA-binding LacI/PurR family transcriptional regulator
VADAFSRRRSGRRVLVEPVDHLRAQSAQRRVRDTLDLFGSAVESNGLAALDTPAELGRDHHLVSKWGKRFADEFLVVEWPVNLGRVRFYLLVGSLPTLLLGMATIKAVAELAGVAPSTVSYVLSGERPIGEETKQRVLDAVEQLGYEPNSSARALRTARTNVLALLGFVSAGYTEARVTGAIMLAMADAVRQRGFDLLLIPSHEGAAGIERLARTSTVDAVIVMGILMHDPRVDALRRLSLPAALMGHTEDDPGISWVDLDFAAAGRVAVELLDEKGHQSFVFVAHPARVYDEGAGYAVRGLKGAREAALANRIRMLGPVHVEKVPEVGQLLEGIFNETPDISAIVLQYEEALPEILRWLRSTGRRVPEDVQVVMLGAWTSDSAESQITYVSSTVDRITSAVVGLAIDAATHGVTRSMLLPPEVWVSRE